VQGGALTGGTSTRVHGPAPARYDITIFEWECDSIIRASLSLLILWLYSGFPYGTAGDYVVCKDKRGRTTTVHVKARCAPAPRPRVPQIYASSPSARAGFQGRVPVRLSWLEWNTSWWRWAVSRCR